MKGQRKGAGLLKTTNLETGPTEAGTQTSEGCCSAVPVPQESHKRLFYF